jgi:hypothetical protein
MVFMAEVEKAVHDLRYLLDRGYPRDSAVNFVSNHYRLPLSERHLLARCVFSKQEAAEHRRKIVDARMVRGRSLSVDGYNVIITLESILTGKKVVRCDDGFVRDLRAIFGKYRTSRATEGAIEEVLKVVAKARPRKVAVFFDKQVSKSGELSGKVRHGLRELGLKGDSRAMGGVDFRLRGFDVVASSDRAVIKRAKAVWDIPAELLGRKKANVLDLTYIGSASNVPSLS